VYVKKRKQSFPEEQTVAQLVNIRCVLRETFRNKNDVWEASGNENYAVQTGHQVLKTQ
jgi:hypothetical protein